MGYMKSENTVSQDLNIMKETKIKTRASNTSLLLVIKMYKLLCKRFPSILNQKILKLLSQTRKRRMVIKLSDLGGEKIFDKRIIVVVGRIVGEDRREFSIKKN